MMTFNKNIIALAGILLGGFGMGLAQNRTCGFDANLEKTLREVPGARAELERGEAAYQAAMQQGHSSPRGNVRVIPTVVHIIASSAYQTVTDAEVQSQIDVLNEDFRKIAGSPGDGAGVDFEYQFCLATIDPNGCPTTGINRLVNPELAYHNQADAAQLKGLIQWSPQKYFNIWVPRTIETTSSGGGLVIGYATFPNFINLQPNLDGVVIHSEYFGRTADPTTIGRTTTHEAGHWVGLYHTFQGGCTGSDQSNCLLGGDRVCDTPQAFENNFGCPSINSCTDTPTDFPDQIENYMDYSDGTCQNMYTAGQKARADQLMNLYRSTLTSPANLAATGCDGSAAPGCNPTADFTANTLRSCPGQPVTFFDRTLGQPTSWSWTFQGGTPATSTAQNPTVTFPAPGFYNVTLVATNSLGSSTSTQNAYITVDSASFPPLQESFESILSLPQGWASFDEDQIGGWQLVTNVTASNGTKCMKVKLFDTNSEGFKDDLISHPVSLANIAGAYLKYDYSYKKKSGFTYDSLQVNISTDCGASWTTLSSRAQGSLVTVAGLSSAAEFKPTLASQWKSDSIRLDSFIGNTSVKIMFRVIGQDGQSIYLDNINLGYEPIIIGAGDPAANAWTMQASPNPFTNALNVRYTVAKTGVTHFTLVDAQGRTVYAHETPRQAAGSYTLNFSPAQMDALPAGIYFLKGNGPSGSITRKVVHMD
jgi:PKD repeat protein